MVDKYTTSDMTIENEVRYPNSVPLFRNDKDNLRAFTTHSQSALLNYLPDG